jgi:REP element-mobilizing transposase RayT
MSEMYQSLSHSRWDCTYHVVFIPKCRRKMLYGEIRKQLGMIFHELARQNAVSTVGFELEAVKKYIREQEQIDQDGRF